MTFDKRNPISVENMFYNILCRAGDDGRALRIVKIGGTVTGVPQYPADEKGFRNLLNLAIVLAGDDDRPTLRIYENTGDVSGAFTPGSHDGKFKIINSLFVNVEQADGTTVVAVNLVDFTAEATATPTP